MYPQRLDGHAEIRRHARRALKAAGASEALVVPLDDVAAAVNLKQEALFALDEDAPRGLRSKIDLLRSVVLGVLAVKKKTIYVDPDLTATRHRFTTAHEIGHHALPWQADAYHADDDHNLSTKATATFELEANAFAGELLFGAGRFNEAADSEAPGIATPLALASEYGNSAVAALRQYAEHGGHPVALLAVSRFESAGPNGPYLRLMESHCVWSAQFEKKFGPLSSMMTPRMLDDTQPLFHVLRTLESGVGSTTELTLDTTRGKVKFVADTFCNRRLRYVILCRRGLASGRQRVLLGPDGRPLRSA